MTALIDLIEDYAAERARASAYEEVNLGYPLMREKAKELEQRASSARAKLTEALEALAEAAGQIERHQEAMNRAERVPTGEDYNALLGVLPLWFFQILSPKSPMDTMNAMPLKDALWWFIENIDCDHPQRTELFFVLRERVREDSD